jgi:hypothetical protein
MCCILLYYIVVKYEHLMILIISVLQSICYILNFLLAITLLSGWPIDAVQTDTAKIQALQ